MSLDSSKGYRALRRCRFSQIGREYFITFCSEGRPTGLTYGPGASAIAAEIRQMEAEHVWTMRCAVIMPDHVHLLFQLGEKLQLGKAVTRLKSKSARRVGAPTPGWQPGYFEHQVRPGEDRLSQFLYPYLNPYRAGLLPVDASWPWFIYSEQDGHWFADLLKQGLPELAWLAELP